MEKFENVDYNELGFDPHIYGLLTDSSEVATCKAFILQDRHKGVTQQRAYINVQSAAIHSWCWRKTSFQDRGCTSSR
ncbi:hypothetical protein Syun_019759 [Stephania yunnanensis]|uniref:Uncharacterized protein n=1 Tax=Stephania yunnanensis TaxID=152371 RepID=A0AAP0IUM4_9MAGN